MTGRELAQAAQRLADAYATGHERKLALVAAVEASNSAQDEIQEASAAYAKACREYAEGKGVPAPAPPPTGDTQK